MQRPTVDSSYYKEALEQAKILSGVNIVAAWASSSFAGHRLIKSTPFGSLLKLLREPDIKATSCAVLRCKFTDTCAGAKFVDLIEQIDDVEPHGQRLPIR